MYPMAVTIMPARMWGAVAVCPGTAIFSRIILFGDNKRPITGWKKIAIDCHY